MSSNLIHATDMVVIVLAVSTADCDSVRLGSNPNIHPNAQMVELVDTAGLDPVGCNGLESSSLSLGTKEIQAVVNSIKCGLPYLVGVMVA
jgi:hypothetical protein